ncbi:hypothetical protein K1T71_008056 [Dendrolimus kikuchii]|uniref:Uncharacterized protein n=1 Tax=Dendrolimus kikuchii TaxID=765133 RepID=A0ACC1D013_9NEOP|nr:hypothetical protein K1T71_008056 [Dendrolimus kikuchii]
MKIKKILLVAFLSIFGGVSCKLKDGYTVDFRSAFDQDLYEAVDAALCREQLAFLANHSLALQFMDASGKLPSGILKGNVNDFGDYHQCLDISHHINNMDIQGKYCTIILPLDQELPSLPTWPEWPEWPEWPDWPEWPELPEIIWPEPDNDTVQIVERFAALRHNAHAIAGLGEPVDNRIFPMAITATAGATFAICIPKPCTVNQAVEFIQEEIPFLNVSFNEYFCRLPNDKPYSAADITATVIFGLLAVIIIISTCYDLGYKFIFKEKSRVNALYTSFSIYTNTKRFLTFNSAPGALECVDGIRAISMFWVIIAHTYCLTLLAFIHNLAEALEWLVKFSSTWITAAPITVDTFFTLSGILAVYTTVGKISKTRFIRTIHLYYLNRLFRTLPLLATVILLQASAFNHISDGPFWQNVAHATENCRTYWWSSLLFIQNYINPLEICLAQTWYLSVDIQLYIISPLIMVFLFGSQIFAWGALSCFVLAALTTSTAYSFIYNFSAALANPSRISEFSDYIETYYINTLTRAAPFCVGMVYGYILHLCRNRKIRISKLYVTVLWISSVLLMGFCIFSMYFVMQVDHDAQIFDNFLNAYMRAMWATALGWLIFACVHGYGGPINWFLSLKIWKLPARLSYAMYLIHFPIMMSANGTWLKTYYFSDGANIYRFMGDITITIIAAFILSICIDAPFSTLQKLLLGGGKKPEKPKVTPRPNIVIEDEKYIKTSL